MSPSNAALVTRLRPENGSSRTRKRGWILDLEPVLEPTRAVRRAEPLRDDALVAKRAGVFEDDLAIDDRVSVG